ncbi:alpha/beta-hydrolase [Ceraceosorus guamensis]|uniref:Alpha/beta-hydrolase n=1 Tax=Ceraceosorus guamensis TaxID=1522189 RepID=A0A316WAV1_9BASI|nr:alpha/beta-hydrolase [Ceraceosorus guamensis]PWN45103.1 alpha/beta-hydrolase [Ceraceosorus guamensis]
MAAYSSFLAKAHLFPLVGGALYVTFILSLMYLKDFQAQNLFLHKIVFPFNPQFDEPERYGLAPHKTRNLRLKSDDGIQIGAWHVVPDIHLRQIVQKFDDPAPSDSAYDAALKAYPTVIYLHGNAANRAAPFRIASYNQFTNRLAANVVAIDYRGFGDSEGDPTEEGLILDAKAAFDWVVARKMAQGMSEEEGRNDILIVGQSLGTGVAAGVTQRLVERGTPPNAVYLMAPYISIAHLLTSYQLAGFVPIFAPVRLIPYHQDLIPYYLNARFENFNALPRLIRASGLDPEGQVSADHTAKSEVRPGHPHIIISSATDDDVIPFRHGETLFESLLRVHLGLATLPGSRGTKAQNEREWEREYENHVHVRKAVSRAGTWAKTYTFWTDAKLEPKQEGPSVSLIRTPFGGHNGVADGIIDVVGELSGINFNKARTQS